MAVIFDEQKLKSDLLALLPDNRNGLINPLRLRTALTTMVEVVAGVVMEVNTEIAEQLEGIADHLDDIEAVGDNILDVVAVSTNMPSIQAVNSNQSNINLVAANNDDISDVADNMAAVLGALDAAVNANNSADLAEQSANRLRGTSTSSVVVGVGTKTFTTQANKFFDAGNFIMVASDADPSVNWMWGQVTSYSTTTLIVDVKVVGGSGTRDDWSIIVTGARGEKGETGSVTGDAVDIDYDNTDSGLTSDNVQDAIDELAAGAGSADNISYDNTLSGLVAEDVQSAIDELAAGSGGAINTFSGTTDGSDEINMGYEPILATNVILVLGGVTQDSASDYTVASDILTLDEAPPAGIPYHGWVFEPYQVHTVVPSSGSVTYDKFASSAIGDVNDIIAADPNKIPNCEAVNNIIMSSGVIIGMAVAKLTSVLTITTQTIPYDDTIPQQSEGLEILTVTYTPKRVDSTLIVTAHVQQTDANNDRKTFALFRDSINDAFVANGIQAGANTPDMAFVKGWVVSGSTSPTTFKLRGGSHASANIYINGSSSSPTGRVYGGVSGTTLTVEELAAE